MRWMKLTTNACLDCGCLALIELFKGNLCLDCSEKRSDISKRKYYEANKEKVIAKACEYQEENKDKAKASNRKSKKKHAQKRRKYNRDWRDQNIERERKKESARVHKRRETDPVFRLRQNVSKTINKMLKEQNASKKGSSFLAYIPYTIQEYKDHIESLFEPWMNWDNQGKYSRKTWDDNDSSTWKWQIDHIIPQSKLPYTSMEDNNFKKCWALTNLQPLSAKDNLLKGDKILVLK